jgi:hypothetical protein
LKKKKDNRSKYDGARGKHQEKKGKTRQGIKKTHLEYGILAAKALDLNQNHQIQIP